jgi:hypothetical protein
MAEDGRFRPALTSPAIARATSTNPLIGSDTWVRDFTDGQQRARIPMHHECRAVGSSV